MTQDGVYRFFGGYIEGEEGDEVVIFDLMGLADEWVRLGQVWVKLKKGRMSGEGKGRVR